MTKLQERVNFRKGKNFRKGLKDEKQKTFEKVLTLWKMIKSLAKNVTISKLKNKLQRNSQQGVKSNGTLPNPQQKPFGLKP